MSPEVAKYCKRAIIDYLAGNMDEFTRLVSIAMEIYKQQENVCECGTMLIEGKMKHGKEKCSIKLCTVCGQVYRNGEKFRKCNVRRVNKC